MRRGRRDYNLGTPQGIARYREAMGNALRRLDINRPFCRPLHPIGELDEWFGRTCAQHGLSPQEVQLSLRGGEE